jgi:hypothetical protein
MIRREQKNIKVLFVKLKGAKPRSFPKTGNVVDAPKKAGVYVIYSPSGRPLHVGCTPTGKNGIYQRLGDHLSNRSSFTGIYLKGHGEKLRRKGYTFAYRIIGSSRKRLLLEAHAIGQLCPAHIGRPPQSK